MNATSITSVCHGCQIYTALPVRQCFVRASDALIPDLDSFILSQLFGLLGNASALYVGQV
jgi:hypothetical protein